MKNRKKEYVQKTRSKNMLLTKKIILVYDCFRIYISYNFQLKSESKLTNKNIGTKGFAQGPWRAEATPQMDIETTRNIVPEGGDSTIKFDAREWNEYMARN